MARLRVARAFTLAISLASTLVFFQNCSPTKVNFDQRGGAPTAAQNNGHGYTGKVVYVVRDATNECAQKDGVKTRVDLSHENNYHLIRENCVEKNDEVITPTKINGSDANRPDSIEYGGNVLPRAPELAARDGFFVLSRATYDGNLGGLAGANAKCLDDLQANDWRGKAQALAGNQINSANVRAFLCASGNCQNAKAFGTYVYSRSNLTASGGSTFTAGGAGEGPSDSLNWDDSDTFSSDLFAWTGRASATAKIWGGSHSDTCADWSNGLASSSGRDGSTNYTTQRRWDNASVQCSSARHLLCFVHP